MPTFLGVRFLATEYVTGKTRKDRIDSLDENGCQVIIEHKRHSSEKVINQGMFYLADYVERRVGFTHNYLLRGVIQALTAAGFIPASVSAPPVPA